MSTTLTNGLKLPDKGSVDWYADMQSNYTILDGAVGTVAEHTSQIAGKAPLVHTHTKADITDFPAYGTTAGTICEGNDSRLSDARTPVAHTHTKSDVTDLFNSANTWTGVNTYTGNTTIDKNSANPTTPDETALAFIAGSNYIFFRTKGSSNFKSYNSFLWGGHQGSGYSGEDRFGHLKIYRASDIYGESGENTPDTSFSFIDIALHYKRVKITDNISFKNDGTINACYPVYNNATDLGTSTNKWKTLNGINPGALSLPKTDSSITGIETSGFSFDGTSERIPDTVNIFSNGAALMNGWLCARIAEGAGHYIFLSSDDNTGRYGICSSCFSSGIVTTLSFGINVYVPIKVGDKPAIRWAKPNGGNAQLVFYPCLGNV